VPWGYWYPVQWGSGEGCRGPGGFLCIWETDGKPGSQAAGRTSVKEKPIHQHPRLEEIPEGRLRRITISTYVGGMGIKKKKWQHGIAEGSRSGDRGI